MTKKELKNQYKETKFPMGVFQIKNESNTAILTSGIGLIINGIFISTIIGYAGILTVLLGVLVLSYGVISGAKRKQ